MATVNAQPPSKGKYSPANRVTGLFAGRDVLEPILESLRQAEFLDGDIDVFMGHEGAEILDVHAEKVGPVLRLWRDLELALTDETEIHQEVDQTLRNGGMAILVFTDGNDAKKVLAAQIMKAYHPKDTRYFGQWSVERM